jgi:trimethylamine--corrinoid protein Co-methyltransferase
MAYKTTLTLAEITAIHNSSLRVLAETGILIDHPYSCEILFDHGCKLEQGRVCFPEELVEASLRRCPPQVTLAGRDHQVTLGDGSLHVHNLGGARDVYDPSTRLLRPALTSDVGESTRLMDALENVTTITPLYTPRDVEPGQITLVMFAETVKNTLKPINGPGVHNIEDVKKLHAMAQVVFGDTPALSVGVSPVSPLNFLGHVAPVIVEVARRRLPLGPLPCPNVGATSPMSLAGALVQQNAENLATIVLAQLVSPGLPIVYCGRLSVISMRSGSPIWGNPEVGMMSAATVQIGHCYHLPVNVYGLAASGYAPDIQSGYERAINALVPALAGADELSGVGEMAGGTYSCNAQIVTDNDIFGEIMRICRGFTVDEESLAVDVIAHAMSTTRNFLGEKHTRKYLRSGEVWEGRLGVREIGWEMWNAAGSPTTIERADRLASDILAKHEIPPLPDEQLNALEEILHAS